MKTKKFHGNQRGHADYGWLQANYSFSFANYRDRDRENFGALRVLNDDFIKGGGGFGEHPHHNMEIISIPLKGSLQHKDSMSNSWMPLLTEEVQVMSAGTGVIHAERNNSPTDLLNLFQIWIIPDESGVSPSYGQKIFHPDDRKDTLQVLVNSYNDAGQDVLKIHQDAQISRIDLTEGNQFVYQLKSMNHGAYVMQIEGKAHLNDLILQERDAVGIWQTNEFELIADKNSQMLIIEVPMVF